MIDKNDLKRNLSLAAVVEFCTGERIPRGGMIACPFHDDNTPSCKIYADHWYCYGCKRHGDVIQWVAEWEKSVNHPISFHEALQICNELLTAR